MGHQAESDAPGAISLSARIQALEGKLSRSRGDGPSSHALGCCTGDAPSTRREQEIAELKSQVARMATEVAEAEERLREATATRRRHRSRHRPRDRRWPFWGNGKHP